MKKYQLLRILTIIATSLMIVCVHANAHSTTVNDIKIKNNNYLEPRCLIFLRHAMGNYPAGSDSYACDKFQKSRDNDVVDMIPSSHGHPSIPVRKKDYISLDELYPWKGEVPIRAYFGISAKYDDPDPDLAPSYLPYDRKNQVDTYLTVDRDGYEVNVINGKRTGYRFYDYLGICYLATEKKPREFKYETECEGQKWDYNGFPKSVDTTGHPWINIMEQNTVSLGERMPADSVEIRGSMPVKPLIYSDFPIGNDGRVTKGRAMCMADCAQGMLMKLLHAGQSIWGASGKPPAR